MGRNKAKYRAGVSIYTDFLGERDSEAIEHWWDVYFVSKTKKLSKDEFNQFQTAVGRIFEAYLIRGEFEYLKELFGILGDLHPKFPIIELDQLRHVLEIDRIRSKHLNKYLKPGRVETLENLVDETFTDFVQANPDNDDIQYYWRDIHDQLSGIAKGLDITDY